MQIKNLIYSFEDHGLYYETYGVDSGSEKIITLTIDTVQLDFCYTTGKFISVTGFLPLRKANKVNLSAHKYIEVDFIIPIQNIEYKKGVAYDFFKY